MTLWKLINQCASDLDDMKAPYLWTDDDFVSAAQFAINRMCEECKFLVDGETASICTITVHEDTYLYDLSEKIIEIEEVYPSWGARSLIKFQIDQMNQVYDWRARKRTPVGYILDYQINKLRLFPIPTSDEEGKTINLRVVRYPLVDFSTTDMDSQTPEIPSRYHLDMLDGMKHKAYLKKDSETYNDKLAATHLQLFEARMLKISKEIDRKTKTALTAGPLKAFT